jgi:hypothetical protein
MAVMVACRPFRTSLVAQDPAYDAAQGRCRAPAAVQADPWDKHTQI